MADAPGSASRLILVAGPIAAGKSALARQVTARLRERGASVALTALDEVADMARPTLPDWGWAHEIHARLVGHWTATGIDVVVDEGASSAAEVAQILGRLPVGVRVLHVVLVAGYATALRRVGEDPTRGISRDAEFLRGSHEGFAAQLPQLPCDLLLRSEDGPVEELADRVLAAYERWAATG